jgi:hypothetical protein
MLGNEGPRPVILHINYGQEIIERSQAIGKKKWVVWNKAIEVNVSRPKTDSTINQGRLMCRDANHRFWDCRYVQRAWGFTNKIFNYLLYGSYPRRQVVSMQWKPTFLLPRNQSKVPQSGGIVVVA